MLKRGSLAGIRKLGLQLNFGLAVTLCDRLMKPLRRILVVAMDRAHHGRSIQHRDVRRIAFQGFVDFTTSQVCVAVLCKTFGKPGTDGNVFRIAFQFITGE